MAGPAGNPPCSSQLGTVARNYNKKLQAKTNTSIGHMYKQSHMSRAPMAKPAGNPLFSNQSWIAFQKASAATKRKYIAQGLIHFLESQPPISTHITKLRQLCKNGHTQADTPYKHGRAQKRMVKRTPAYKRAYVQTAASCN